MKTGSFNINEYLERLYEEAEEKSSKTSFMDGGEGLVNQEGVIIPQENKKTYDWLKREFQKGKTEVKVEMKLGGAKFEPGYDLQTNLKSVKDFKPGMFGEVKTSDTEKEKKPVESIKDKPAFQKGEGEMGQKPEEKEKTEGKPEEKEEKFKSKSEKEDIKDKDSEDDSKVKKVDLKTKKK